MATLATDGVSLWFGNQHTLRAYDIATGDVTTLAGRPNSCAAVDGAGTDGYFHDIRGLTYYNGFVYLLDGCEETLRRFNPSTNAVVTIAGTRHADPAVTQQAPYTVFQRTVLRHRPPTRPLEPGDEHVRRNRGLPRGQ